MKKLFLSIAIATTSLSGFSQAQDIATVYYMSDITPENLVKIYKALGREAHGKVAVKISTGETDKSNHLRPQFIKPLVDEVNGTIVECCTAYQGTRNDPEKSYQTAKQHGYTEIAKVDIMDDNGQVALPVKGGKHLKHDLVGKNWLDYDFTIVLSHFKGHAMGGFGGALKNVAIGMASSDGKSYIHSAGRVSSQDEVWKNLPPTNDEFLESMAEACQAVMSHAGDKILYINVANRLSVDCDCNGNPDEPKMSDIGIYASLDPVALDQACVDAVFNSTDPGKGDLVERINSRHGTHILSYAPSLGIGTRNYRLVKLD